MTIPFAWFDNIGPNRIKTTEFLSNAFGWTPNDIGLMTFLTKRKGLPFATTYDAMEGVSGWAPYVEVDALPEALAKAKHYGAVVIAENLQGSAGIATFIADPGGAPMALWKRDVGM
jgi:predicted enzyme related to lactoylglutathione lyase